MELLAGALPGAAVLGQCESKKAARNWGHTMIAIRPSGLVDGFEQRAASILQAVKASGPGIRLPGEASTRIAEERERAGMLQVPTKVWEAITATAQHGLP